MKITSIELSGVENKCPKSKEKMVCVFIYAVYILIKFKVVLWRKSHLSYLSHFET